MLKLDKNRTKLFVEANKIKEKYFKEEHDCSNAINMSRQKSQNIIKIVTDIKMCTFLSCSLTMQNNFLTSSSNPNSNPQNIQMNA